MNACFSLFAQDVQLERKAVTVTALGRGTKAATLTIQNMVDSSLVAVLKMCVDVHNANRSTGNLYNFCRQPKMTESFGDNHKVLDSSFARRFFFAFHSRCLFSTCIFRLEWGSVCTLGGQLKVRLAQSTKSMRLTCLQMSTCRLVWKLQPICMVYNCFFRNGLSGNYPQKS